MRVVIAGPRDLYPTFHDIARAINLSQFSPHMIITGGATGVDTVAYNFARYYGIQPIRMEALWDYYRKDGKRNPAGPIRNANMASVGDALLVIKREGRHTKGTSSMLKEAGMAAIPIYVHEIEE